MIKLAPRKPAILTLFLAFSPSREFAHEVRESLQSKNSELVLEIKHDPTLIGGAAIIYKNHFRDYSLKNTLEHNKEKIARRLGSV